MTRNLQSTIYNPQSINLSRLDFLALLKSRGIAYLNYTPEELEEEFAAVQELEVKASK